MMETQRILDRQLSILIQLSFSCSTALQCRVWLIALDRKSNMSRLLESLESPKTIEGIFQIVAHDIESLVMPWYKELR